MRILYVTGKIDWPLSSGVVIRRWNVLQGLLLAGQTDVVVFSDCGVDRFDPPFVGCHQVVPVDLAHLRPSPRDARWYDSTLGRLALTVSRRLPFEFSGSDLNTLRTTVASKIDYSNYDLIWFNTARTAFAIGPVDGRATVLDGDDFEYVREGMLLRSTPWYGAKIANYLNWLKLWWCERRLSKRFSAVVRCSESDCLRHPDSNLHSIPNGTTIPSDTASSPANRLLFVGLMNYSPNSQGVGWFIKSIWPLIRKLQPSAQLDIVGKSPPDSIAQLDGVNGIKVHGFVEDLAPLYRAANATIVPLLAGSGTRLKILESLSFSVPVVSTTLGAFGLDANSGQGLDRCDGLQEFAQRCVDHLRDPEAGRQDAGRGREFVMQRYDWSQIQNKVAQFARSFSPAGWVDGQRAQAR